MNRAVFLLLVGLLSSVTARALPLLQLDIVDGVYVAGDEESVVSTTDAFSLVALYDNLSPSGLFYISAAITPIVGGVTPDEDFGSFVIDGVTYSYTNGNMEYGGPPVDNSEIFPELPTHGIFPTWFSEVSFLFNPLNRAVAYNVQDNPGGYVASPTGSLVYNVFDIDITGLNTGFAVHFDLYDELIHNKKASLKFAPFSHDAVSRTRVNVPETASTLLLLTGAALSLGWWWFRRPGAVKFAPINWD